MKHSFDWSSDVGDFFFKGLTINSATSLSVLCLALAIFAIIYESMKVHSAQVRARAARERQRASSCAPSETANLLSSSNGIPRQSVAKRFAKMLGEALVFLVHNSLGYGLMLSVMMFNGYIFLTVVLGMGLGYFLFGHISMKINMENMQARTTNVICSPACPEDTATTSSNYPTTSRSDANRGHPNQLDDISEASTTTVLRQIQQETHNSPCHTTNNGTTYSIRL